MKKLAALYQSRHPEIEVRFGFLESSAPSFASELEKAAGEFGRVRVLPLFLFPGAHTQKDIPRMVEALWGQKPQSRIEVAPFLRPHPALAKLLLKRLVEAGFSALEGAPLLLVGHGAEGREPEMLLEQMRSLLHQAAPRCRVEACFVGVGEPSLEKKLEELKDAFGAGGAVAPYLLFPGFFLGKIEKTLGDFQFRNPAAKIFLAGPLGSDDFLFEAFPEGFEKFQEA